MEEGIDHAPDLLHAELPHLGAGGDGCRGNGDAKGPADDHPGDGVGSKEEGGPEEEEDGGGGQAALPKYGSLIIIIFFSTHFPIGKAEDLVVSPPLPVDQGPEGQVEHQGSQAQGGVEHGGRGSSSIRVQPTQAEIKVGVVSGCELASHQDK